MVNITKEVSAEQLASEQNYHANISQHVENWLNKDHGIEGGIEGITRNGQVMVSGSDQVLSTEQVGTAAHFLGAKRMAAILAGEGTEADIAMMNKYKDRDISVTFKSGNDSLNVSGKYSLEDKKQEVVQELPQRDTAPQQVTSNNPRDPMAEFTERQNARQNEADMMDEAFNHMSNHPNKFSRRDFKRAEETAQAMGGAENFLKTIISYIAGATTYSSIDWQKSQGMSDQERDAYHGETRAKQGLNARVNGQHQQDTPEAPQQEAPVVTQNAPTTPPPAGVEGNALEALLNIRTDLRSNIQTDEIVAPMNEVNLQKATNFLSSFESNSVTSVPTQSNAPGGGVPAQGAGMGGR